MRERKAYSQQQADIYDHRHFGGASGQHILQKDNEVLEALLPDPPALVLDVPCGTGIYTASLQNKGYDVIAADASLAMLKLIEQRQLEVPRSLGDINYLPFKDSSIDAAIVLRLFSHFSRGDVVRMLGELRRVIRPKGRIVFDTFRWSPRHWPGVSMIMNKSYIYTIEDRDVEEVIREAGLQKINMSSTYLFSPIWERKLPLWMLERLTNLEHRLPQKWLLRPFWACTKK